MKLNLAPFKRLIKERCGLLFEDNGEEKLAQALAARSDSLALKPAAYYTLLQGNEAEFQELVNLLTINETYFFREAEQIRLLVDRLAPRFLAAHDGRAPVRILSAGCSSGEEPYSLAMALQDKYGESVARLFAFAGADIDSTVLAKAKQARYTDFSFRGVPADIKSRHFDKDRWGYVLKDKVRQLVSFHELNLLADTIPSTLRDFDIVYFRNVSIYFDAPTRKIIQQNLAKLMKDDGVLVIGTAETLANDLGVLPLVEEDGLFYFIKGHPPLPESLAPNSAPPLLAAPAWMSPPPYVAAAVLPVLPPAPPGDWSLPAVVPTPVVAAPAPMPPPAELATVRQFVCDKRYDDALPHLDAILTVEPGNAEARLLKAHVSIERKDFATTEELAQRVLAVDAWSIDALLLLGLAAKWQRQEGEAIRCFKQAVYSRHECWPGHYYLADLYRQSGETELARRAYRVVIQLLAGGAADTGIKYLPLNLPAGEIRFLCEHQLAKLPGAAGTSAALAGQR